MAKGFVGFMQGLANLSEQLPKLGSKIGSTIGDTIGKVGTKAFDIGYSATKFGANKTIEGGAKAATYAIKHEDEIKAAGQAVINKAKGFNPKQIGQAAWDGIPGKTVRGVGREAGTWGLAAVNGIEKTDKLLQKAHIWKKTDLDDSLIGRKFTGGGVALFAAGAMAINAGSGAKGALDRRQGRNDGRIHRITPSMTDPYNLASQMASTQIGQSFANNAGADGDLVRAVHNMR